MTVENYKQLLGVNWAYTVEFSDVPEKVRQSMIDQTVLNVEKEQVFGVGYSVQIVGSGNWFVIVTKARVIARDGIKTNQALLKDVTGVDRESTNVRIRAADDDFFLFRSPAQPKAQLIERLFKLVHTSWLAARAD